ncbi:DUF1254 domain-containing protein [Amphritea sp. HPY]|uniref:DUF1254 domain-containing protein n=1 Tax=Amphritea sp. HPY TaxID=3421652 RepID=UPI003D7EF34E
MKRLKLLLILAAVSMMPFIATAKDFDLSKADIHDRMAYHRAIDAVVWSQPLMNFKTFRDALTDAGAGPNDVSYFATVQNWKFQTATPNNTTPYIMGYWNMKDGPIVVELPSVVEGLGMFGTIMDAWQRPIEDVGSRGRDKGQATKYLLIPSGYKGPLLRNAKVYTHETNSGFIVLRPIIAGITPDNMAKVTDYAKGVKIYPLSQADNPPEMKYVDLYDKQLEMTPVNSSDIYNQLHGMIQEEVVLDRDLSMMGLLARIGIKKGEEFKPDSEMQAIFKQAAPEAREYLIEQYHRKLNPWIYDNKKWSSLTPLGDIETDWTFEYPAYYDYVARGGLYYAIITSIKNYGTATFYVDLAETSDGQWLDGSNNYRLRVPPNVPVSHFWSVTAYDLETASYIRDVSESSIDSITNTVQRNADGSIDIYFGPKSPEGKESNWLPTEPGRRFFMLFRAYGPQPGLFDGSFELNDIEPLN